MAGQLPSHRRIVYIVIAVALAFGLVVCVLRWIADVLGGDYVL